MRVFHLCVVPLRVQVSPTSQVVDVGRTASFRCLISGSPINSIEWFKDGKRIVGDGFIPAGGSSSSGGGGGSGSSNTPR